jgi:hypothetical protein
MAVMEKVAFAVAVIALAALVALFGSLVATVAAPEPQVGPDGRVPAWVEDERPT